MSFDLMVWVLNHSETRGADRLVLVALASHQNGQAARPAISRLMHETKLERRSVFRSLARLEDAGLIEAMRKGPGRDGTNGYWVRTGKVTDCHQYCCLDKGDLKSPVAERKVTSGHGKVTLSTPKGDSGSPEQLKSSYEPLKAQVTSSHLSEPRRCVDCGLLEFDCLCGRGPLIQGIGRQ
jgi:DNA-binding transcriptional ArsR family regulator